MNMKNLFNLDKIKEKLQDKNKKNYVTNLAILLLFGILLAVVGSTFSDESTATINNISGKENVQEQVEVVSSQKNKGEEIKEAEMERKLKNTLESIKGVGKVQVMVYFKGGEEQVPAININDSTSLTEEKDTDGGTRKITQENEGRTVVMMNTENGTEPFVLKKENPEVTGVFIVAEGANDNLIKLQIQQAVVKLFGLNENQVTVYPMKK